MRVGNSTGARMQAETADGRVTESSKFSKLLNLNNYFVLNF
jgi:hypothetical protein